MENIKIKLIGEIKTLSFELLTSDNELVNIYVDMIDEEINHIQLFCNDELIEDYEIIDIVTKYINTNK